MQDEKKVYLKTIMYEMLSCCSPKNNFIFIFFVFLQPHPEPVPEVAAGVIVKSCPPKGSPEYSPEVFPEPEPGGAQSDMRGMDECKEGELGNYTFDGCLQIMLDMNKLCVALNVHSYLFGTLFILLVIIACFALYPLIINKRSSRPAFMITINILVIIFGTMRSVFLFVDAYGLKGYFQTLGALLFADLAMPCLTSAFALVQWAFLELLQFRRINKALQSPRVLVAIVVSHFLFVAVVDFLLYYVKGSCFLMTVCQAVTTLWGLILTFGFLYTTQKLVKRDKEHRLTLKKSQYVFSNQKGTTKKSKKAPAKSLNNSLKNEQSGLISRSPDNSIRSDKSDSIKTVSGQYSPRLPNSDVENQVGVKSSLAEATGSETNTDGSDTNMPPAADMTDEDPIVFRPLKRLRNTLKASLSRSAKERQKSYLTKVKNVGIFTTIMGVLLFGVSLYGIAVYNPFVGAALPHDWGWYTFQTLQR